MIYSEYGKTGMKVSKIGFGGMRFDTKKSIEENARLVEYAFDKGINYFDTAPTYCGSLSEKIFGCAFKHMKGRFYVSTKAMPADAPTSSRTVNAVKRSMENMNVDRIDVMHIWCVRKMENFDLALKKGGMMEGLVKLKEEGLIKHIAVSLHLSSKYIMEILKDERLSGILIGLNIFNYKYRFDAAVAAYEKGMGVAVMNPLYGGFIPKNEEKLKFLAIDGFTPSQYALRFAASLKEASTVLNGFTELEHVDNAVLAMEGLTVNDKLLKRAETMDQINLEGACTACGYCDKCPNDIYIPAFMQIYNNKLVLKKSVKELKRDLKEEYMWGGANVKKGKPEDCIACGLCEEACTQQIPIIERLKEMSEWQ